MFEMFNKSNTKPSELEDNINNIKARLSEITAAIHGIRHHNYEMDNEISQLKARQKLADSLGQSISADFLSDSSKIIEKTERLLTDLKSHLDDMPKHPDPGCTIYNFYESLYHLTSFLTSKLNAEYAKMHVTRFQGFEFRSK